MSHKQELALRRLSGIGTIAREEAERLRIMGLVVDEAVWLLVLGSTVRAMQDLRNHQFAD